MFLSIISDNLSLYAPHSCLLLFRGKNQPVDHVTAAVLLTCNQNMHMTTLCDFGSNLKSHIFAHLVVPDRQTD